MLLYPPRITLIAAFFPYRRPSRTAVWDPATELVVSGIDSGFEGIPAEIDAGRVAIRFTNDTEHDEPHEMVLFRRNDGVDDPIEDLLALPEDEVMSKVSMAGVVFAAAPGSEARSEERRVGKECVSTCRSRWSP